VWGEYACEDVFEADLEGRDFDADTPPGADDNDRWPYINVYGNCNTCEAYLVDYYSTKHYESILLFQRHAMYYGMGAAVALVLAMTSKLKRRWSSPTRDHHVDLLTNQGGVVA